MRDIMGEKISIIVPVYNLETEIVECISSIRAQTYSNIEIIIVDDGSTDQSRKVISELAKEDHRIVTVFQENSGVTMARLSGLRVSTGKWIGFVDGDDYIEPRMYEVLLANALKYNAQISHCGYQMRFCDGRVNFFYNTGCLEVHDNLRALKELISGTRVEPGLWNKLYHRAMFNDIINNNIMDASIQQYEDLLMNYYLFKCAEKSVYEDKCYYHYNVRYTSSSRQSLNEHKIYDPIRVAQIILEDVVDDLSSDAKRAYLGACISIYNVLVCDREDNRMADKACVRGLIRKSRKWMFLLDPKKKILGFMICYISPLYPIMYRIYETKFQKKRYC